MITNDMGGLPSGPIASLIGPAGAAAGVARPGKPFSLDIGDDDRWNRRATTAEAIPSPGGALQDGVPGLLADRMQSPKALPVPIAVGLPSAVQGDRAVLAPLGAAPLAEAALPSPAFAGAVGSATQMLPSQTDVALGPPTESPPNVSKPPALPPRVPPALATDPGALPDIRPTVPSQTQDTPVTLRTSPGPSARDTVPGLPISATAPPTRAMPDGPDARQAPVLPELRATPGIPNDPRGQRVRDTVPALQDTTPAAPPRATPDAPPGSIVSDRAKGRAMSPVPSEAPTPPQGSRANNPSTPTIDRPTGALSRPDFAVPPGGGKPTLTGQDRVAAIHASVPERARPASVASSASADAGSRPSLSMGIPARPPEGQPPLTGVGGPTRQDAPRAEADLKGAPPQSQASQQATPTAPLAITQSTSSAAQLASDRAAYEADARLEQDTKRAVSPPLTKRALSVPAQTAPPDITAPTTAPKAELPGDLVPPPRVFDEAAISRAEQVRQNVDTPGRGVEMARSVQSQLVEAARATPDGRIEVKLAPEELGRVRMTVSQVDADVMISVLVERTETLDLMRRHADILSAELRQAGFERLTFSFGHSGDPGADQDRPTDQPLTDEPEDKSAAAPNPPERPLSTPVPSGHTRLDIRL